MIPLFTGSKSGSGSTKTLKIRLRIRIHVGIITPLQSIRPLEQVVQADGKEGVAVGRKPSKSPSPRKKAQMALMKKRGEKDIPSVQVFITHVSTY